MTTDADSSARTSTDKNAGDWRAKGGFVPIEKSNGYARCARRVHTLLHMTSARKITQPKTEMRHLISASHVIFSLETRACSLRNIQHITHLKHKLLKSRGKEE